MSCIAASIATASSVKPPAPNTVLSYLQRYCSTICSIKLLRSSAVRAYVILTPKKDQKQD